MTIIEKMFYGTLNFGDEVPEERNVELEEELDNAREQFCKNLSEKHIEELDELLSLDSRTSVCDMAYFFKRGVETGFQLAQELKER